MYFTGVNKRFDVLSKNVHCQLHVIH